jgi:hypothetical protein
VSLSRCLCDVECSWPCYQTHGCGQKKVFLVLALTQWCKDSGRVWSGSRQECVSVALVLLRYLQCPAPLSSRPIEIFSFPRNIKIVILCRVCMRSSQWAHIHIHITFSSNYFGRRAPLCVPAEFYFLPGLSLHDLAMRSPALAISQARGSINSHKFR